MREDPDGACKAPEILGLRAYEREPLEERNDPVLDVREAIDLPVPAAVPGPAHGSATERLPEQIERSPIVLRDVEGGGDPPAARACAPMTAHEHEAGFA